MGQHTLHPLLYYLLLFPATFLTREGAGLLFYLLQFVLFPLAVVWMVQSAGGGRERYGFHGLIAFALAFNFEPLLETMAMHKVEGIEFFLICLSIFAFRKKRDLLTGILLILAVNLKYLPAVLLLFFLLKRETRVLAGAACGQIGILLLLLTFFGIDTVRFSCLDHPLRVLLQPHYEHNFPSLAVAEVQSLTATVNKLFALITDFHNSLNVLVGSGALILEAPRRWAFLIDRTLKILLAAGFVFWIRKKVDLRSREKQWARYLLEISGGLLMTAVLLQGVRNQYLILVLPAFVYTGLLLVSAWATVGQPAKILFVLSYSFTAMLIPGGVLNRIPAPAALGEIPRNHLLVYQALSIPFLGLALLGVCTLLCRQKCFSSGMLERAEPHLER